MAGASLFTLLDDLTTLLDDVAVLSKVAAKKTAGVVGDDLALNAHQVQGVAAAREWPVVWAVAQGSLVNKVILVPSALVISAFAPFLIKPLLMLGGSYLCFEGAEKLLHARSKDHDDKHHEPEHALSQLSAAPEPDMEKLKIRGAIRTDFVLSAEIVVLALGTLPPTLDLTRRAVVLGVIALGMTVGVYGLVAGIVKIDDFGLYLMKSKAKAVKSLGKGLVGAAPWLMRLLSVLGTVAMFLVGGEILTHGVPGGHPPEGWLGMFLGLIVGVAAGFVLVGIVTLFKRMLPRRPQRPSP